MSPARRLLLALLLLLPLHLACGKAGECGECSDDSDCEEGLVCSEFFDTGGASAGHRCGSGLGKTTCRTF